MDASTLIEAFGYLGSALVLVSFLMSSVVRLRIVNTVGSTIFAIYALIIHSYPTAVMNLALVCINLRFLWKLRHQDPSYRLLALQPGESYVQDFLQTCATDIAHFFPQRRPEDMDLNRVYMVFHGSEPAGILMGYEENGVFNIGLDYTTAAYRDCSVGNFIVEHLQHPLLLRYANAEEAHTPYLKRMGFEEKNGVWEKQL